MQPKLRLLACGLVVCAVSTGWSQQPDPNSPRYQGVVRLRDLLKSKGDKALTQFVSKQMAASWVKQVGKEKLLAQLRATRKAYSKADLAGARPLAKYGAELMFDNTPPGVPKSLSFKLASKPPHRFLKIDLVGAGNSASAQPLSDEGMAAELGKYLAELAAEDAFSGAVLLAKEGQPLFAKAYGLASRRYNVPNKLDTKFNIGSMNKMFTGVAICQLAQQGKLTFEDKIIDHVPDYPNRQVAEAVTVHHLLTHTSGMGSYWNDKYSSRWWKIRTVEDLVSTFCDDPLAFPPGQKFQYSNAGPVVLGLIIERVSGQSYYDYIRDHVAGPAGMENTDCYEMDQPVANLAIGYTEANEEDGSRRNNLFLHSAKGGPAGGGYSTIGDLLRFASAIRDHKLLNPEYTELLLTAKGTAGPGSSYGYLFGDRGESSHRFHGHNGGGPGISAELSFYPELGYTVVVLANYGHVASEVASFARRMIDIQPRSEGGE